MSQRLALVAAIALALLAIPATSPAQALPPEAQELVAEMQEIEGQLAPIQHLAMQDSVIQLHQDAVTDAVRKAMVAADSANAQKLERFDAILAEAEAAEQAGDTATVVALTAEVRELQPQLMAAQQNVMAQPEVEARMTAYFDAVEAKMIELDPNARALIDRLHELNEQVTAILGAPPS